jgi:hypothetical protein
LHLPSTPPYGKTFRLHLVPIAVFNIIVHTESSDQLWRLSSKALLRAWPFHSNTLSTVHYSEHLRYYPSLSSYMQVLALSRSLGALRARNLKAKDYMLCWPTIWEYVTNTSIGRSSNGRNLRRHHCLLDSRTKNHPVVITHMVLHFPRNHSNRRPINIIYLYFSSWPSVELCF